jgi:6-methylsalicylate decarboxylase
MSRRWVVKAGLAALASTGPVGGALAQQPSLIDVHHHMFPPALIDELGRKLPQFMLPGAARSLSELDAGGVSRAMISYPASDIIDLPEARLTPLIRQSNDFAMSLVTKPGSRYGLFASLPLPHIDASLKEIAHAFDDLQADGVMAITSYQNRWLGDPHFAPVMQELNRRKAVVYTHPGAGACCTGLVPGVNDSIVEFESDTARTIASLLFSGAAHRWPDIRFIFSHAGGTMPILIERFRNAHRSNPQLVEAMPQGAESYLRAFHYDTAQAANPMALGSLLKLVPASQVMFGTDFPHRRTADQLEALKAMGLATQDLAAITSVNAQRLLPRLR